MQYGHSAFHLTGTPVSHGPAIQTVADRLQHAILFRAVGAHCTRLLEEGYAAKGFRIDTKSCDWGPMRGFVCVDPRLSKGGLAQAPENTTYTEDALTGAVRHDAVGGLDLPDGKLSAQARADMADWVSGCKPIVISAARVQELRDGGHITVDETLPLGVLRGTSNDGAGEVRLPWRLIPTRVCNLFGSYRNAVGGDVPGAYGVFAEKSFELRYPRGARPVKFNGFEAILGLTNPGSEHLRHRACVTGDYDLFGVWAPANEALGAAGPALTPTDIIRSAAALGTGRRVRAVGEHNWDARYVDDFRGPDKHHHQHYQLGNITRRLNLVKTQLNTMLQTMGGYTGGALVHHSDEVGNPSPGLKKTLDKSMPLLAFLPGTYGVFGIENQVDFGKFVLAAQALGLVPDLRPEWRHFLR